MVVVVVVVVAVVVAVVVVVVADIAILMTMKILFIFSFFLLFHSSPGPNVFSCEILVNFVQHVYLYLVRTQVLKKTMLGICSMRFGAGSLKTNLTPKICIFRHLFGGANIQS